MRPILLSLFYGNIFYNLGSNSLPPKCLSKAGPMTQRQQKQRTRIKKFQISLKCFWVGNIRPKPTGQINKNWMNEYLVVITVVCRCANAHQVQVMTCTSLNFEPTWENFENSTAYLMHRWFLSKLNCRCNLSVKFQRSPSSVWIFFGHILTHFWSYWFGQNN